MNVLSSLCCGFCLLIAAALLSLTEASNAFSGWDPVAYSGPAHPERSATVEKDLGSGFDRAALMQRLIEVSYPLRATGASSLQRQRLDGLKAPDALHAVAIMVEFADSCFYGRQDLFEGLPTSTQRNPYYAAHDALYYTHLLRDVTDYYQSASGGTFMLNVTVHGRVVELPNGMAYYGNHPEHGEQPFLLAADAIGDLDQEIDFTQFDTVILIHAGAGQETDVLRDSPEQIYSTYLGPDAFRWGVEDSTVAVPYIPAAGFAEGDGVRHILILPETQFQDAHDGFSGLWGSLGTYCFVVGLRLGMLSLSDFTPRGAPDSQGVGQFCLMGYGLFSAGGYIPPHPCVFNRVLMGWIDPYLVDPELAATWTVRPNNFSTQPQTVARIDLTGSEYYLIEYRLKDVNGNRIFSFAGDLNGNNIPDYYDRRNPDGSGRPLFFDPITGERLFFDPDTCERERMVGAEWDFFLYYEAAYDPPMIKGAGSGIYIWHIDEGVIRDAFGLRQNLFNADPQRKSVDLVEADGIQDLDSRAPSPFWLGGDDDSFRAEGNDTFGPDTRPATTTNGGVRTGLWIDEISNVVVDSTRVFHAGTDSQYTGILYAESMAFRCWREEPASGAARLLASRDLYGVDMTASHLLVAPLDGDVTAGEPVFVAAADSGRVYAWRADLLEWIDEDDDPSTFKPLAVGTDSNALPVSWHMPAAAGKLDPRRSGLQIVLTAPEGLYAFDQDGTPLANGPGDANRGLIAALPVVMPPVLLPLEAGKDLDTPVIACVVVGPYTIPETPWRLHFLDHTGSEAYRPVDLPGRPTAAPVHADRVIYLTIETAAEQGILAAVSWPVQGHGEPFLLWDDVDLGVVPGPYPPLVAPPFILVSAVDGRGQTIRLGEMIREVLPLWAADVQIAGPLGPGGAFHGPDLLGRVAANGVWQTGWPQRPVPAVKASAAQPLGLACGGSRDGSVLSLYHLFATRDGRLYLTDPVGTLQPGWPVVGPADLMATPVVVSLPTDRGSTNPVLMVAGTTPQIVGLGRDVEDHAASLQTRAVTRLRSWALPDTGPALNIDKVGAMYGGSPWRGKAVAAMTPPPAGGVVDLSASHICYPQPLTTDILKVGGHVARDATARVEIFNLQGEKVRSTDEVRVMGGMPFELDIDMRGVASGLYLCRLQADGMTSVKRIAVTR